MEALRIENLCKTYANGVEALKHVDLTVPEGHFFGLLGPNAAGKSTLIGIISSLITKTQGKVFVFGHDLDTHVHEAKACIGLAPQEFNFNPAETPQYILIKQAGYYGMEKGDAIQRSEELLKKMDLEHKCSEQVRKLSGGFKRRLMIARALVHKPKLLILDEPSSGVDIETRQYLWEFLREINQQGTTIILTTHYLEEAELLCRDVAIIDQGALIEQFAMQDILKKLDNQTFILHLVTPLRENLLRFSHTHIDELTIEVSLAKEQNISELITELASCGVDVMSMRNKTNRLEELFFALISQNGRGQ